ncbi:MAG: NFACT family protein, partial [Armatimonadetes bacterium]|nr:NFACT family protein [Armatimonadota bacterium]
MKPTLADSLCYNRLCDELGAAVKGTTIRRVVTVGPDAVALETTGRRSAASVFLSWARGAACAYLLSENPRGSDGPPPMPGLPKLLTGAVVQNVCQIGFDRVIIIELTNLGGLGPDQTGSLVLEATDREPNCVLVQNGRVVSVARPRPLREGVYRCLVPGEPYVPPPGGEKLDPRTATAHELARAVEEAERPLAEALRAAVQGLSGLFLQETLARAGLEGSTPVAQQPPDWPSAWLAAVREILSEAARGRTWLWRDEAGRPVLAYPVRLLHLGREPEPIESLSIGLEAIGRRIEEQRRIERLRGSIRRSLKRQLESKKRLLMRRHEELAAAQQAEKWRRWGELIVANLHSISAEAQDAEVEVTDYYSPNQERVRIPLVSGLGPKASAEEYFARYRKARRAAARLPALV